MRATSQQVNRLREGLERLREQCPGAFERHEWNERFRWDCLWAMQSLDGFREIVMDLSRDGMTDNHIDTALRAAFRGMGT